MGTSPEAFNEVRNLLKKLDRSIDAARSRRLSTDDRDETVATDGAARSMGRAKPIRRGAEMDEGGTFIGGSENIGAHKPPKAAPRSGNF